VYTVIAQREIPAPVARVWGFLTEPDLVARWFADADRLALGEAIRFAFGDGDYHDARVVEWEPGIALGLAWSFLGLGPRYEVRYTLLRRREGTELSVTDRGALTVAEAECLRVGWSEFLLRLDKAVRLGVSARFRWRKMITLTARVERDRPGVAAALADPGWYASGFPGVRARALPGAAGEVSAALTRDGWQGAETRLRAAFERVRGSDYLYVTHEGWGALPAACAAAERQRFVPLWQQALARLPVR
jgi:uncharacterized protein YndB with AHSA1/START domain